MATSKYEDIVLTPEETKAYKKIIFKLLAVDTYEDINVKYFKILRSAFGRILKSARYSDDFKKKLVFQNAVLDLSLAWACKNFTDLDLSDFLDHFLENYGEEVTTENIELIYTSENFKQLIAVEEGWRGYFVLCLAQVTRVQPETWSILVERVIADNLMTLRLAEDICTFQKKGTLFPVEHDSMWPQRIAPVAAWARETYNLGDIPDSWVVKFLEIKP